MHQFIFLIVAVLTGLSGACASSTSSVKLKAELPALATDEGRIYIYTPFRDFARNFQPRVLVNGKSIGHSRPGTFLVLDQPSGEYTIEAAKEASFADFSGQLESIPVHIFLAPFETTYIRMQVDNAGFALHVSSIAEDAKNGRRDISTLTYQGGNASTGSK